MQLFFMWKENEHPLLEKHATILFGYCLGLHIIYLVSSFIIIIGVKFYS